jgi:hypothetical protein
MNRTLISPLPRLLRARSIITAGFGALRRPSGNDCMDAGGRATQEAKAEARKGAHARCMQPFAQRSRAGWIGVPKWVVIVERALRK